MNQAQECQEHKEIVAEKNTQPSAMSYFCSLSLSVFYYGYKSMFGFNIPFLFLE